MTRYSVGDASIGDGGVNRRRDLRAPPGVGVENARLRPHHHFVFPRRVDPQQVIVVLRFRQWVAIGLSSEALDRLRSDSIGCRQVLRVVGRAHPAEGAEAE